MPCHGWVSPSSSRIDANIAWSGGRHQASRAEKDYGKPAVTRLKVQANSHDVEKKHLEFVCCKKIGNSRKTKFGRFPLNMGPFFSI